MKRRFVAVVWLSLVLLATGLTNAWTQDPNASVVQGSVTGTALPITGAVTSTVSGSVTANQGTAGLSPWLVELNNWLPYPWQVTFNGIAQPVTATQSGSWTVGISGTPVVLSAQSGAWTVGVNNFPSSFGVTQGTSPWLIAGLLATDAGPPGATNLGTLSAIANASAPAFTEGNQVALSTDLTGNLRVVTTGGNTVTQGTSPWVVDGSGHTQPVSGTVTANAGSGTFTVGGTLTANAGSGTFTVDGSGHTQPVSAASLPLPTGASTEASLTKLPLGQGSTTSGQSGPLAQGAVTTAAPTYTTAQTSPLSLTTAGALRVDGSAATQPVSGTVTANAGSGTFTVGGTVTANAGTGTFTIDGSGHTQPVSAASLPLPTGAATEATLATLPLAQGSTTSGQSGTLAQGAVTTAAPSYTTAKTSPFSLNTSGGLRVDGSAVTQPVSGTITANAGSGTFTVDGSGHTQPVSGTVTANQGGAPWSAVGTLTNNNAAPSTTNVGTLPAKATAAAPSWTEGNQVTLSTDLAGSQRVTVTNTPAVSQSGTWNVGLSAGSNTVGKVDQGAGGSSAWKVDGSAVTQPVSGTFWQATQPVSGTVTANAGTGTFTVGGTVTANAGTGTFTTSLASTAGTISTANSSTATLTSGSVFTGTGEDVSGFASIGVSVIADQASAAAGLSFQWSSNNSNWDVTEAYTVAVSTAQSFALVPRARYFRIVYTNGGTGQGAFRLQTVFRQVPLIQGGSSGEPLRIDPTGTTTQPANVSQVNGTTTDTNSGTKSNGTLRVVLATDQPALTNALTVTANAGTGTLTVAGGKTNNNAAPGATNVGTLGAVANASAPSWTEGNLVALSTDLSGALRTTATSTVSGTVTVAGNKTNNNAAPGATNIGALPAVANAAVPSFTEGNLVALSSDLSGRLRTDTSTVAGTAVDTNSGTKSNGTQRIVLATDQPALTNALKVDGSATTQPVSGTVTVNQGTTPWAVTPSLVMVTATYTRPNNTTAYTAGDVISDSTTTPTNLTFTSCGRVSGGAGRVVGCVIVDSANQTTKAQLELYLFDTAPVATADNAVWAPSDTEANAIQIILSTNTTWAIGNVGAGATGNAFQSSIVSGPSGTPNSNPPIRSPFKCVGSANLFGVLVVRNAFTPVALESFQIRLFIEQD